MVEKENRPLLCADYQRYSSKQQENNSSLETQSKFNLETIDQIGGIYVKSFVDKAQSAYSRDASKRPAIVELLNAIKNGDVNCVVFYDESRLSRQILDFYTDLFFPIMDLNKNIQFYKSSTKSKWDPMSNEAKQNLIQACRESAKKVSTSRNSQEIKLKNKERPGSCLPLGIKYADEDLIPDENFPLVLLIFELASWGYSERMISEQIVKYNLTTHSSDLKARKFTHTSIHHILYNRLYIGEHIWNKRTSKNNSTPRQILPEPFMTFKPLVPMSLWNLAHAELQRKRQNAGSRMKTSYLVSSKVQCGTCSSYLMTKNSIKRGGNETRLKTKLGNPLQYYYCPNCNYRIDSEKLDYKVLERLNNELKPRINKSIIENKIKEWLVVLKRKAKDMFAEVELLILKERTLERYNCEMYSGIYKQLEVIHEQVLLRARKDLEEINQLIYQLNQNNDKQTIECLVNRVHSEIWNLPLVEKRYTVLSTIKKISVSPEKRKGSEFHIDDLFYQKLPIPFLDSQIGNEY